MKLRSIQHWLQRHPVVLGLSISGVLLFGLLVQELLLDRFTLMVGDEVLLSIFRIAVVHCFMAGYYPAAYYALLRGARATVHQLEVVLDPAADPADVGQGIHVQKRTLFVWGLIGLLISVAMPYLTDDYPWVPSTWEPEVWWHRVLGLFAAWWFGWLVAAVADTSVQISRLAARVGPVDLLDLSPWYPFVRQGLLTALLIVGGLSVQGLRLFEPGERIVVAIIIGLALPLALLGLWLPVRGAHQRIREAKVSELEWTREKIRQSRALLQDDSGDVARDQMPGLVAYLQLIEGVPEWPVQGSAIVRVLLYTLLPVASWFGSRLIEGVLGLYF